MQKDGEEEEQLLAGMQNWQQVSDMDRAGSKSQEWELMYTELLVFF